MDILDILLDEDNREPVTFRNEQGRVITFEQIAVIPRGGIIYCILKPVEKFPGLADDEAIVFRVDEGVGGEATLCAETDEAVAVDVFNEYYTLLEDNINKRRGGA